MEKRMEILRKENLRDAKTRWSGRLGKQGLRVLDLLSSQYRFSVALGDLLLLDGCWYVTHAGLLRLAHRTHCASICVQQIHQLCDLSVGRWVFKATVYKSPRSRGFVGYGDADPSNVSSFVHGAEMRVAETRAVNRALRKAYGIGLCSVEELKWLSGPSEPVEKRGQQSQPVGSNGSNNGHPRLRDRLCLLIRQYNLDPTLVKAYAADFCGTPTLKDASRELVESFITHLASSAKENRDGLVCKLNSYAQPVEVKL